MILEAIASILVFSALAFGIHLLAADVLRKIPFGISDDQLKDHIPTVTYYSYPILLILMVLGIAVSILWFVYEVCSAIIGLF